MSMGEVLLEARGVCKSFGTFRALDGVTLTVGRGEVHGLLGANGAGKSTLIAILSGALRPDGGSLHVAGEDVRLGSLAAARKAGIVVVHQELMLFPDRTVEENVFAGALPARAFAPVGRRARRRRVEAALARLGAKVALDRRLGDLSLAQRQLVEIARALCSGGSVLVLDEPTSSLSQPAAQGLFDAIRTIVAGDAAVVFVSHRLDEVFAITDRLTVLRDGCVAGRWPTAEADIPTITRAMVGELADERPQGGRAVARGAVALAVRGSAAGLAELDLKLHVGEVVGLAGLEGSGVATALQVMGGVVPIDGSIEVEGRARAFRHPSQAIGAGIVYMPADRKKDGLWLERTAAFNIGAAVVGRMLPGTVVRKRRLETVARQRMAEVGVRASALRQAVGRLSGGNQQRVLLGRLLESQPRILLLNDFTRGVDVKAKAEIHRLIRHLADAGLAILVTSSDLEELLAVADRIVCMRSGRIVEERASAAFDKLTLLTLASAAPPRP